jgi:hypothetical protein
VCCADVIRSLEQAWRWLPRGDVAGKVCVLIDLAIIHLREGRLDAAETRLAAAESLTATGRDPAGRAHIHELMGVLWWARGEPRRALRYWKLALTRYRTLDHRLGIARCLQHLGSAMVVMPEYGSLLLDGQPSPGEVLRQATGWLAEAVDLRRTAHNAAPPEADPSSEAAVAQEYLEQARSALRAYRPEGRLFDPAQPVLKPLILNAVGSWPLTEDDKLVRRPWSAVRRG